MPPHTIEMTSPSQEHAAIPGLNHAPYIPAKHAYPSKPSTSVDSTPGTPAIMGWTNVSLLHPGPPCLLKKGPISRGDEHTIIETVLCVVNISAKGSLCCAC